MNTDTEHTVSRLLHGGLTERVIGVFFDVYNELGFGFLESVYERAMQIALEDIGLAVQRQAWLDVAFRGRGVGRFKVDLLVESCLAVELKARSALIDAHVAQLLNFLRGSQLEVGLLFNFGPKPSYRRLVYSASRKAPIRVHPR